MQHHSPASGAPPLKRPCNIPTRPRRLPPPSLPPFPNRLGPPPIAPHRPVAPIRPPSLTQHHQNVMAPKYHFQQPYSQFGAHSSPVQFTHQTQHHRGKTSRIAGSRTYARGRYIARRRGGDSRRGNPRVNRIESYPFFRPSFIEDPWAKFTGAQNFASSQTPPKRLQHADEIRRNKPCFKESFIEDPWANLVKRHQ